MTDIFRAPGNRFDLEQAIMAAWQTKDDIDLVFKKHCDDPTPMSEDTLSNLLLGITTLHDARCNELFNQFEASIREVKRQKEELIREAADIARTVSQYPYATINPMDLRETIATSIEKLNTDY